MSRLPEWHPHWWLRPLCSSQNKETNAIVQHLQTITQNGKVIKKIRLLCVEMQCLLRGYSLQEVTADDDCPLTWTAVKCHHPWMWSSFTCHRHCCRNDNETALQLAWMPLVLLSSQIRPASSSKVNQ